MEYIIKENVDYCLSCPTKPCTKGCPLGNDITDAIKLLKEGKEKEAYYLFSKTSVLGDICGRICPHENQCEGKCIRGIKGEPVSIGKIESYLCDLAKQNNWPIQNFTENVIDKKVAIIGGGPAGLTCAAFLKREGVKQVTIYEKYDSLGGIINHSIPGFRLDKKVLNDSIARIVDLGIDVKLNTEIGKNITLDSLKEEYDAVFIGIGANLSTKMGIPGEEKIGVLGGNELLENKNYPEFTGKKVAVIGGGNVAMDVCRTIKRMNPESVTVIYRRSEKEMPAEKKEIKEAKEEGVKFLFQNNILEIYGNEKVEKVKCIKTELVQKEGDSRLSPVNIEGSEYILDVDYIIMALGSKPEEKLLNSFGLELNKRGKIQIDEYGRTSDKKIYSGGDIVGAGSIAWAAKQGRDAAYTIIKDFKN